METSCGYGYDEGCKEICPSVFHGQLEAHRTPQMTRCFTNRLTSSSPGNLTSGEKVVKKKRQRFPKLPPALPNSYTLPYIIHVLVGEHVNSIPFQDTRQSLRVRNIPVFQDRLTHVQLLFTFLGGRTVASR